MLKKNDVLVKESILHGSISPPETAVAYMSVNVLSDVIVYVPADAIVSLYYVNHINMEEYYIDKDIKVFYLTATSFPEGVGGAFKKLLSFLPKPNERVLFAISNPNEKGIIIYKAAVEESFPGEGEQNGCETFVIKKGKYWSELLPDWRRDESIVGKTFQKLLKHPHLDKSGYCLEIYPNEKDVRCLVPLL